MQHKSKPVYHKTYSIIYCRNFFKGGMFSDFNTENMRNILMNKTDTLESLAEFIRVTLFNTMDLFRLLLYFNVSISVWISGWLLRLIGQMEMQWNAYYFPFPLLSSFRQFLFSSQWIISTLVARFPYSSAHLLVCNVNAGNRASCFFLLLPQAFKEMLYSAQDQAPSIEGKYQSIGIKYHYEFYGIALHLSDDEFLLSP